MSIVATVQAPSTAVVFSSLSATDRACFALRRALFRLGYNQAITDEVLALAHRDKDLTEAIESGRICSEDVDQLTAVFAGSFDAVPLDSDAWDDVDDRWVISGELPPTDAEIAEAMTRPRGVPTPEESRAFAEMDGCRDVRARLSDDDWADRLAWAYWREEAFPVLPDYEAAELAEVGILV